MKTLIVYTSKHGSTRKIASYMAKAFQADHVNLLEDSIINLENYDRIIVGGSIYYRSIHPLITEFMESNMDILLSKTIGLFLVCLLSEESAAEQFNLNFNELLLNHSSADGFFGGVLEAERLSPLEKVITSFTFKNASTFDQLFYDEVDNFIEALS